MSDKENQFVLTTSTSPSGEKCARTPFTECANVSSPNPKARKKQKNALEKNFGCQNLFPQLTGHSQKVSDHQYTPTSIRMVELTSVGGVLQGPPTFDETMHEVRQNSIQQSDWKVAGSTLDNALHYEDACFSSYLHNHDLDIQEELHGFEESHGHLALKGYRDFGDPDKECIKCGALFWFRERTGKQKKSQFLMYSICCMNGKVNKDVENANESSKTISRISLRELLAFKIHERKGEAAPMLNSRRLFQQYLVEGFKAIGSERLRHLSRIVNLKLKNNPALVGKHYAIPLSYPWGNMYRREHSMDVMEICRTYDSPKIFISFKCNPNWPEIQRFSEGRGLTTTDRPDIICRVFKMKLDELIEDVKKNEIFWKTLAVTYTIEFQKQGLPLAHILVWLAKSSIDADGLIDGIISAQIPSKDTYPELHELVRAHMIHGPCGNANSKSTCMDGQRCTERFPKNYSPRTIIADDGFPTYTTIKTGITVKKCGVEVDNCFVVPYNASLLLKYNAHINVEWCNKTCMVKYLFRNDHKAPVHITANVCSKDPLGLDNEGVNVSACKAVWRILAFEINYLSVPVLRLGFHLPNEHPVYFDERKGLDEVVGGKEDHNSMFQGWLDYNRANQTGRHLTYAEFPSIFEWNRKHKQWTKRMKGCSLGRLYKVAPNAGEKYYLMKLLNIIKGATRYEDLRTVNVWLKIVSRMHMMPWFPRCW